MNLKFVISYDGSAFSGSQTQPNKTAVQDEIEKAFLRLNIDTKIVLSGRTDKNVHASYQVFNAIVPKYWSDLKRLKEVLNRQLNSYVKVRSIKEVDKSFHSRFSATKRVYRYIITTKQTTPFNNRYVTYVEKINQDILQKAVKEFIGLHNFKYFHKTGSDKENTKREVYEASFYKFRDGIYVFRFCANSYLRSQIRLMVGFLLAINSGDLTIEDLKEQLALRKDIFKVPALANGLYLAKVYYNKEEEK